MPGDQLQVRICGYNVEWGTKLILISHDIIVYIEILNAMQSMILPLANAEAIIWADELGVFYLI